MPRKQNPHERATLIVSQSATILPCVLHLAWPGSLSLHSVLLPPPGGPTKTTTSNPPPSRERVSNAPDAFPTRVDGSKPNTARDLRVFSRSERAQTPERKVSRANSCMCHVSGTAAVLDLLDLLDRTFWLNAAASLKMGARFPYRQRNLNYIYTRSTIWSFELEHSSSFQVLRMHSTPYSNVSTWMYIQRC